MSTKREPSPPIDSSIASTFWSMVIAIVFFLSGVTIYSLRDPNFCWQWLTTLFSARDYCPLVESNSK